MDKPADAASKAMIELVLMFTILPKTIYPLAIAKGRCPVRWTLFAGTTWLFIETLIIGIYLTPFALLAVRLGKLKEIQIYLSNSEVMLQAILAAGFVYLLALISGISGSVLVRRYLARQSAIPVYIPPLPCEF